MFYGFQSGFGPDGANISGYFDHLNNIKAWQIEAILNGAKFQRMYFNQDDEKIA